MKRDEKGSRMAIIFNGSPLFTGDAGSGESEIRRWLIEEDLLKVLLHYQINYFTTQVFQRTFGYYPTVK